MPSGRRRIGNVDYTWFFDSAKVEKAESRARRRNLNRCGGLTRTIAKRSMRKKKGVSAPGQPPHAHVGFLRKFLFYAYDPLTRSVVVGPAKLRGSQYVVPHTLEFGSEVLATVKRKGKRSRVRKRYRARPFMQPALEKLKDKYPTIWRNTIR